MDSNSTYQYEPVIEADAIRLLELKPAQNLQAKVECSLINTTLSECDDDLDDNYTALSYVWGDPPKIRSISIEEKKLGVTVNPESALRHMRHPRKKRLVWADVICID
jgi:hypothetical protein